MLEITYDFKWLLDLDYRGLIIRYRGEYASEQQRNTSRFAADIAAKICGVEIQISTVEPLAQRLRENRKRAKGR
ncbi:MAG: hypothetical protein O2967_18060 [Proteobacteria bacterium]|nr:hypothetical protein [Pseudomonadota bacterium]